MKEHLIVYRGKELSFDDLKNIISKKGLKTNNWYLINRKIDGNFIDINDGLDLCFDDLMVSILITDGFVFIKEETSIGAPIKYILVADK